MVLIKLWFPTIYDYHQWGMFCHKITRHSFLTFFFLLWTFGGRWKHYITPYFFLAMVLWCQKFGAPQKKVTFKAKSRLLYADQAKLLKLIEVERSKTSAFSPILSQNSWELRNCLHLSLASVCVSLYPGWIRLTKSLKNITKLTSN